MGNLQSFFLDFHDAIKLEIDDNQALREKREELLDVLKENIDLEDSKYDIFHQGSYTMHTGVKPLEDGDYDIDVGLLFNISIEDYPNPVTAKKLVFNALKDDYEDTEMKYPCVTVKFEGEGDEDDRNYHVDFTIYSNENDDGKTYLAKGKLSSVKDSRTWEHSDPKELVRTIKENLMDKEDRKQFRRVIRYLKRWKDLKFKGVVNRPSGIGLTVAGLTHFSPHFSYNAFTKTYNDLDALESFVQNMINSFSYRINEDGEWEERLEVNLPTPPYNDIYEKMTGGQMKNFKSKLESLIARLKEARDETDPVKACEMLQKEFGEDFPVPTKEESAQQRGPAIMVDHSSA
ncbi:nucleotidyltransferase [Alkalihalobacillus oceani]|uniref:Cyclic GMP-AMP synthase n=1 Tax=Halalkalibacter oceani TaxID=1653776 RepID=A0A9X2DUG0_9BACI|nr:nucleotidyltransferase [Halalkalibacter oceani]MCM3716627.1 nucleotidyltransferase [Halalkalibacter oceani]